MLTFFKYFLAIGLLLLSFVLAPIDVNTDVSKYNQFMGPAAEVQYRNKWGMDETIFPMKITANMDVTDYKMVYYDPWDKQFLSYLVVKYSEDDYHKEVGRLKEIESTDYIGYYGVTGFTKYELLAMNADSYNGFVYAITDNVDTIIYVEIIFCNYYMDINYKEYINEDYLPDGFDATMDNQYMKDNSN